MVYIGHSRPIGLVKLYFQSEWLLGSLNIPVMPSSRIWRNSTPHLEFRSPNVGPKQLFDRGKVR